LADEKNYYEGQQSPQILTIINGNIVKQDNGNGDYYLTSYDAVGNTLLDEEYRDGKVVNSFAYKYDNMPNYGFALFPFKGWLPQQLLLEPFFFTFVTGRGRDGIYNRSEVVQKRGDSKGGILTETERWIYNYNLERVTSYRYNYTYTGQTPVSDFETYTFKYTGDCN
jgi:hypothetical protein